MTETLDPGAAADELFLPAAATDPHPVYRRIRQECPVARTDLGDSAVVLVSRYEDVNWALRHPEYFTSAGGNLNLGEQPLIPLEFDPPEHTKYRRLLSPQFVPRAIQTLEPKVRRIVRGLIDAVAPKGSCDFHEEIATPLPSEMFLALMGLPMRTSPSSCAGGTNRSGPTWSPVTSRVPSASGPRRPARSASTFGSPSPRPGRSPPTPCCPGSFSRPSTTSPSTRPSSSASATSCCWAGSTR